MSIPFNFIQFYLYNIKGYGKTLVEIKRMKKYMAAFVGLTLASACAQSPDSISPIPLGNAFASTSCRDANSMLVAERSNLSALSAAQKNAVAGDAFGVLLIGVPVSSLAGADREGDIGVSKGKILALEERVRSC